MEKVAVLLAAYNGRQWIDEQLQSILSQEGANLDIYISVDLSSDETYSYLTRKYNLYNNIFILPYGERFGSAGKNFFRLVREVNFDNYSCVAFSDQDDIWCRQKLKRALSIIDQGYDAYSGNVTAFWENGKKCIINKAQKQVQFDYLFEAAGPGCTYVFTKKLAQAFQHFLKESAEANSVALHDWLLYAFARSNSYKWYIDNESHMLYRQHNLNEVGANNSIKAWKKRISLVRKGWYKNEVYKLVQLFNKQCDPLISNAFSPNYFNKLFLAASTGKLRRRSRDRITLSLFLILNIF